MQKLPPILAIVLTFCLIDLAKAQCSGNITLSSQAEVEEFAKESCKVVNGDLEIIYNISSPTLDPIVDLSMLTILSEIRGDLIIKDHLLHLTSLRGLENIALITGDLVIENNSRLNNIDDLGDLRRVGGFIQIKDCRELRSLEGLHRISRARRLFIRNCDKLVNLKHLQNLRIIDEYLRIHNNDGLSSLNGLQNISSVGSVVDIIGNSRLESLTGLSGLSMVGTPSSANFTVKGNDRLRSLHGLENLVLRGNLYIQDCSALATLEGLENLDASLLNIFILSGNSRLEDLADHIICPILANKRINVQISQGNGFNPNDIKNQCQP